MGMNVWMILLAAQVLVTVIAFARGTKQDSRFQEDKLDFRSQADQSLAVLRKAAIYWPFKFNNFLRKCSLCDGESFQ